MTKAKATDWKGIATLITALLAVLGFFWNKIDGCAQATRVDAVQAASYDTLGAKLGELTERVSALEQALVRLPELFKAKQAEAAKLVSTVKPPTPGVVMLQAPEALFQKSGLPQFDALQKEAAE